MGVGGGRGRVGGGGGLFKKQEEVDGMYKNQKEQLNVSALSARFPHSQMNV